MQSVKAFLESWWATASMWEAAKFWIPTGLSLFTGYIVFKDRWAKLELRERKGEWLTLKRSTSGIMFRGLIEVTNLSNRANAIVNYHFYSKQGDGTWNPLESELYRNTEDGKPDEVFNVTPLTLPPYTGVEVRVQAFSKLARMPYEMVVKIEIEDVFHKHYSLIVTAKA